MNSAEMGTILPKKRRFPEILSIGKNYAIRAKLKETRQI